MATKATKKNSDSSANLGFEAKLWLTADKLRNNMDAGALRIRATTTKILLTYASTLATKHRVGIELRLPARSGGACWGCL